MPRSDAAERNARAPLGGGVASAACCAAAVLLLLPGAVSDAQTVYDGFEQGGINTSKWTLQQIEPRQLALRALRRPQRPHHLA